MIVHVLLCTRLCRTKGLGTDCMSPSFVVRYCPLTTNHYRCYLEVLKNLDVVKNQMHGLCTIHLLGQCLHSFSDMFRELEFGKLCADKICKTLPEQPLQSIQEIIIMNKGNSSVCVYHINESTLNYTDFHQWYRVSSQAIRKYSEFSRQTTVMKFLLINASGLCLLNIENELLQMN